MHQEYVHRQFEYTASAFPEKIAIIEQYRRVTYKQLNEYAGKISKRLKALGGIRQCVVGVYLDPSTEYIVSILGILKAGGYFMPIGSNFPEQFITSVVNATRPVAFLTNEELKVELINKLPAENNRHLNCHVFVVSQDLKDIESLPCDYHDNPPFKSQPFNQKNQDKDGCYILVTSGSTGKPKPIWGSHKGLNHFIRWEICEFKLNHEIRASLFSPISFDVSLRDIFVPLFTGGTICIPAPATTIDPKQLVSWLSESRISLTHMVPTLFRMLTRELGRSVSKQNPLPDLRWILIAGEPLFGIDLRNWRHAVNGNRAELVNLYGPSETTLAKLYHQIAQADYAPDQIVPLGRSIPDTETLILNNNRLCKQGEIGEIHIKTAFASKGYYNDPERTKKCFIQNPLVPHKKEIIFRTGDYGMYLNGGIVQFVGRKDKQFKLQGKRIDMNPIELHLRTHRLISDCAICPKNDRFGNPRLVAYLVLETEENPTVEALKRFLANKIPDYMIPSIFITIKKFPLTHSGKIDRNALPDPKPLRPLLEQQYVLPEDDTQSTLCKLWCDVLGIDKVGIHDNFFDIGGSSLLSMIVSTRISDEFGITLSVVKIFEYPQIFSLANYLKNIKKYAPIFQKINARAAQRKAIIRQRRRHEARLQ